MHALFIALGIFCNSTLLIHKTAEAYETISAEAIRKHTAHLSGVYSNEESLKSELAQLSPEKANNPMFRPQNIVVYRFWEKQSAADEWWYYLGWYASHDKEAPLEEAILHFTVVDGMAHIGLYSMPEGKTFPMEWKNRQPFDKLSPKELMASPETTLYAQELPGGGLRLFTPLEAPFQRTSRATSAYSYINFDVRFYSDQVTSKSTFLDANRQLVPIKSLDFAFNKLNTEIKDF